MKRLFSSVILVMIFSLINPLSTAAQNKTATAQVSETAVYDEDYGRYLTSVKGEVENPYTGARISKRGNKITFEMHCGDSTTSHTYVITNNKVHRRRVLLAKGLEGKKENIRIVQEKHVTAVYLDYNEKNDRYDSAIIFSNIKFQ